MWFATEKGVVKYDGYEFIVFNTADGLPNEDVWKLQEDQKGRIWIYGLSEKFGYIKGDKYHEVHLPEAGKIVYPTRVADLKDGRCVFSFSTKKSDQQGICYIDDTSYSVRYFKSFIDNKISSLNVTYEGILYAMTDDKIYDVLLERDSISVRTKCTVGKFNLLFGGDHYFQVGDKYILFCKIKSNLIHFFDFAACKMYELNLGDIHHDTSEYYYVLFDDRKELTIITNKYVYTIEIL